jgi:hypothetical protein
MTLPSVSLPPPTSLTPWCASALTGGKIVEINLIANPARLRQLDLAVLDG